MSRLTAWTAALLILIGSVWSQEQFPGREIPQRLPRFGFGLIEPLRKSFCQNFCTSSDTMPYFTNLACAVKCPELYLPHTSTPMSTSSATTAPPSSTTSTTTSSQVAQTTATPSGPTTQASSSTPTTMSSQVAQTTATPSGPTTQASSSTPTGTASTPITGGAGRK